MHLLCRGFPAKSLRGVRAVRPLGRLRRLPSDIDACLLPALVTGGARRIGRAIALGLAADGWDMAVHYGRSKREARPRAQVGALGRRAALLPCDLATSARCATCCARASRARRVSCVVNNASLFEFDSATGFHGARHARLRGQSGAPVLLAQGAARATPGGAQAWSINLLDQKLYNLNPDFCRYTLSKAALKTATRCCAGAGADTCAWSASRPASRCVSGDQTEAGFAKRARPHAARPLQHAAGHRRRGRVLPGAARAVTGTTLLVDGGQHLMPLPRDVMFLDAK